MLLEKKISIAKLGEPILREHAKRVENINAPEIKEVIEKMLHSIKASHGVGLAAPQIFESYQILIISSHPNERYPHAPLMQDEILINPTIITQSQTLQKDWEGCLSIPGIRALVPRHTCIEVEYTKANGTQVQVVFEDFIARIFQHEYDHLIGKVYLDSVEQSKDIISEEFYFKNI